MDTVSALKKFLFIGLVSSTGFGFAQAAELKPRPLKVCTVAWPPYTIVKDKQIKGYHTEIVEKAIEALGFPKPTVNEIPWKRCLRLVETGQYDVVYSASKNPEREAYLHYPKTPLQTLSYVFMVKENAEEKWSVDQKASSLPQPIGVPAGFSVSKKLHKEENVKLDESARDDEMNMKKLEMNRVGTIIIESTSAKMVTEKLGIKDIKALEPAYAKGKDYFIAVSKKIDDGQALVSEIDRVLPSTLAKK